MLDIKYIRDHPAIVEAALKSRGHPDGVVGDLVEIDKKRREIQHETEQLRAEQNEASQRIARLKKEKQDASEAIAAMRAVSEKTKSLNERLKAHGEILEEKLLELPNLPHDSVPVGRDENDNRVERTWGDPPSFDFESKDHVDLGEQLGILDFERAAKLAGARFVLARGPGALLERALINFMLDIHTKEHGYTETLPPFIVNDRTMRGTGQLPKFKEDLFRLEGESEYYLIPTAEVPLTNIHADEILDDAELPLYYTAYTPCFRSEAGSYGKDVRGMLRQHQFNKVELVKYVRPEESYDELDRMCHNAEVVLQRLEIPHRVVTLCTGDMGFAAAKTYDIEVWLPGQNRYREISSCSNCTDFQARRANIRFRRGKKPEFVHTLNGSGVAVGRAVIALLENFQNGDGTVTIPNALRPYMNGLDRITSST